MTRPTDRCPHDGKLMHPTRASTVTAIKGHRYAAEMTGKTENGHLIVYRCDRSPELALWKFQRGAEVDAVQAGTVQGRGRRRMTLREFLDAVTDSKNRIEGVLWSLGRCDVFRRQTIDPPGEWYEVMTPQQSASSRGRSVWSPVELMILIYQLGVVAGRDEVAAKAKEFLLDTLGLQDVIDQLKE